MVLTLSHQLHILPPYVTVYQHFLNINSFIYHFDMVLYSSVSVNAFSDAVLLYNLQNMLAAYSGIQCC